MDAEVTLNRQRCSTEYADTPDSDAVLAHRIASGDTDAWSEFFRRYSPWAYRFAYTHLNRNRADAEDLCSEIILTAAKSIEKFDPRRGDLDAWVYGLARHCLSRFYRNRHTELPLIPDIVDQSSDSETTPAMLDQLQAKDVVNRALSCLPERPFLLANLLFIRYNRRRDLSELACTRVTYRKELP